MLQLLPEEERREEFIAVCTDFALWADSYDDRPDADRAAHKAVPVNVGLILAGSIESIVITVNVTV